MRPYPAHLFKPRDPAFVKDDGEDKAEDDRAGARLGFVEERGLRPSPLREQADDKERT